MGTNLYQEAIAEARQLREMAEQNAKNKIINAVTPKIRALIERELLNEEVADLDLSDDLSDLALPAEDASFDIEDAGEITFEDEPMTLDLDTMAVTGTESEAAFDDMANAGGGMPSIHIPADANVDVEIGADGSVVVDTGSVDLHVGDVDGHGEEDILLSQPMAEALTSLLQNERKTSTKLKRIQRLENNVRKLSRVFERLNINNLQPSQQVTIRKSYTKLLREAFSLYNDAILTEGESDTFGLRRRARSILKEMKQMAYKKKDLFSVLNLFEAEENDNKKEELDEVDAQVILAPADEEEAEELEALLGDLDLELTIEEPGEEDAGAEDDFGGEEEAADEEEEFALESDGISVDVAVSDDDEIVEISETMLRRELRRMRRLRESEGVDASVLDNFGGGSEEGDSFVDVDEDTLLNALADELGDNAPMPQVGSRPAGGDAMPESYRRRRAARNRRVSQTRNHRVNESRKNRALSRQLVEYKKAVGSLRTQLTEMNLFNAKLLYANKLMQNRNVTPRQQRTVVESLDKAKTLREAKLLYQSLTASLNKVSTKGRSLTESRALRGGSSSKSTRSAAAAKSGVEVDRWAVLAGIGNE
jgi:hypothetical protein